MLRKYLAVTLLVALALVVVPRLFKRYPSEALVNAPIVDIRSPLESTITKIEAVSTGKFEEGPRDLVTLKTRLADQLQALQTQERMLAIRADSFVQDEKSRLQLELAARQGELARAELDAVAGERDVARQVALMDKGFISAAQLKDVKLRQARLLVQRDIATANVTHAQGNLKALVKSGFMGERAGGADVSYTQQKLDEVRLRIDELAAWTAGPTAVNAAPGAGSTAAVIRTPGQGLLIGPVVTEGAFLASGDLIANYVLCNQAFIDLSVAVSDLKDYRIGQPVNFRVAGEWSFYEGTITQVHPLQVSGPKAAMAVKSDGAERIGLARVWVQPSAGFAQRIRSEPNCMMGQKVHAQLPSGASWIKRSTSFLADVF